MTNEERDIINQFIARVGGGQPQAQPGLGGSVPATTTPAMPPVDPEADRLEFGDLLGRYPDARYRITQLAFVQEHALAEAQNRIQRLEWEVQQARAGPAGTAAAGAAPPAEGFLVACLAAGHAPRRRRSRVRRRGTRAHSQATSRPPRRLRNTRRAISPACSSGPARGSSVPR